MELLIVISIMAILAAMIFPVLRGVNRRKLITRATGELNQMESYINSYKARLGYFPPDNPGKPGLNQLYYELAGTVFTNGTAFVTKDGTALPLTANMISAFFGAGVSGFINSDRGNSEKARSPSNFSRSSSPARPWTPRLPTRGSG
jgi:type II secretory pathway pseudopilin PulG